MSDSKNKANLLQPSLGQFRSKQDTPLTGGRIDFRETGTQEPAEVYSGPTMEVSLGTSVPIDLGGFTPAIWLDNTISYSWTIYDKDGVIQRTDDDLLTLTIPGIEDPTAANFQYRNNTTGLFSDNEQVGSDYLLILGYSEAFDGGGGFFVWDKDSLDNADLGMVFRPYSVGTSQPGRWKRMPSGVTSTDYIDAAWFGCIPGLDGSSNLKDLTTAFNRIQTYMNKTGSIKSLLMRSYTYRYRIATSVNLNSCTQLDMTDATLEMDKDAGFDIGNADFKGYPNLHFKSVNTVPYLKLQEMNLFALSECMGHSSGEGEYAEIINECRDGMTWIITNPTTITLTGSGSPSSFASISQPNTRFKKGNNVDGQLRFNGSKSKDNGSAITIGGIDGKRFIGQGDIATLHGENCNRSSYWNPTTALYARWLDICAYSEENAIWDGGTASLVGDYFQGYRQNLQVLQLEKDFSPGGYVQPNVLIGNKHAGAKVLPPSVHLQDFSSLDAATKAWLAGRDSTIATYKTWSSNWVFLDGETAQLNPSTVKDRTVAFSDGVIDSDIGNGSNVAGYVGLHQVEVRGNVQSHALKLENSVVTGNYYNGSSDNGSLWASGPSGISGNAYISNGSTIEGGSWGRIQLQGNRNFLISNATINYFSWVYDGTEPIYDVKIVNNVIYANEGTPNPDVDYREHRDIAMNGNSNFPDWKPETVKLTPIITTLAGITSLNENIGGGAIATDISNFSHHSDWWSRGWSSPPSFKVTACEATRPDVNSDQWTFSKFKCNVPMTGQDYLYIPPSYWEVPYMDRDFTATNLATFKGVFENGGLTLTKQNETMHLEASYGATTETYTASLDVGKVIVKPSNSAILSLSASDQGTVLSRKGVNGYNPETYYKQSSSGKVRVKYQYYDINTQKWVIATKETDIHWSSELGADYVDLEIGSENMGTMVAFAIECVL
jgi:hypothetical protein